MLDFRGMSDFQNPPLVRDVDDSRKINVATPRALKISVSDARQIAPIVSNGGNTLMFFSGLIRFGQDGDPGEDTRNEANEYAEAGHDDTPRTVMLQLRGPLVADSQFIGSGAFAAFGDIRLTTNDSFGTAVDNGATRFMQPIEDGNQLGRDLWFLADINAEKATDDTSLINRVAYQASVLAALK
jgi:hypothetical protein